MFRRCLPLPALGLAFAIEVLASDRVTYNEHIRPILAENCFVCHGADYVKRRAKRRLDSAAAAIAVRKGIRAIVPTDVEKSELWWRITSTEPDEMMPPEESHKPPLKPEQRELIRQWISQGAVYQSHWAFEPVSHPDLPGAEVGRVLPNVPYRDSPAVQGSLGKSRSTTNPVDAFIGEKLAARGLEFSPEAPREVLLYRLTLDLTGLPPTPEEIDALVADRTIGAYERAVDRLLASPHYGEHFGRHWLDAVRYGDTHGLHIDNVRTIWPYRDWVVNAFNRNMPFDQFTIEQLAGDLLPNPQINQLVASGYNRCHLSTSEGGAIEEEAEARNTADRVNTTAAVWLGLTANCASCHDHKFDPLTQREYYSFGAFFKGLADRVWDGTIRLPGPIALIAPDAATQRRIDEAAREIAPLESALTSSANELAQNTLPITALVEEQSENESVPSPDQPEGARPAEKPVAYEVVWAEDDDTPMVETFKSSPMPGVWQAGADVPVYSGQRALRIEGRVERPITFAGGDLILVVRTTAKVFVQFRPDPIKPPRAVGLEFISEEKTKRVIWGDALAFGADVANEAILAGPIPENGAYTKLEIDAAIVGLNLGKRYTGLRITQSDGSAWWDHISASYSSPSASVDPLLSSDAWARSLQEITRQDPNLPLRHDIKYLVGINRNHHNAEEKARLKRYHRDFYYGPLRGELEAKANDARKLLVEQIHYELTLPSTLISRERANPLPAHVLVRGQYDKLGERVEPATPAFLPPLIKTGDRASRLDFARWLVDSKNPLTARVTVNRVWLQLFGSGIVRTPADFGMQGDPPSHPELLDWLASEFVAGGWNVKKLVRLLVTSRTYRQDSRVTPQLLEIDPENKLLARSSRYRIDAEVLRDRALALSGLLQPEIGGPPVKPYQPTRIWEPLAVGESNTKTYVQDHGDSLYRRSLYTFWKRTAPPPAMTTFDAPSRESFCIGRGRSNTPLQALALMNDVQQFEAARAFAERLLTRPSSERNRLAYAFRYATGRTPTEEERALLTEALTIYRTHFRNNSEAASAVLTNGESKSNAMLPVGEFAAWTMVANSLLNLDETVARN